jgi:predicted flap endonuclease-1-like 5' DNA nuclease
LKTAAAATPRRQGNSGVGKKDHPSYPIVQIGGIDAAMLQKLKALRIRTTARLLEAAKSPKGRKLLAQKTGIPASTILRWANKADLMRVKGIGDDYTNLLQAVGVGTMRKLRAGKPAQLAKKMAKAKGDNGAKLVRVVPSEKSVERWVSQARDLPLRITY